MFRNTLACFALLSSSLYAMEPSFNVQVDKDASHMICRVTFTEGDASNIKLSYLWLTSLNNRKNDFYGEYPRNQLLEGDNTHPRVTPLNLKKVDDYNWTKCQVTAIVPKGNTKTLISPPAKVVRITEDEPVHFIPNLDITKDGMGHSIGVFRGNMVYLFAIENIAKTHSLLPLLKTALPKKIAEVYETSIRIYHITRYTPFEHFHFALLTDGSLFGWGKSIFNAIGDGQTTEPKYFPVPIKINLPGKIASFIPAHHGVLENVAILNDGSLFHWGNIDPKKGNNCKKEDYCLLKIEQLSLPKNLKNLKQIIFNSRRRFFLMQTGELLGDWYELSYPPIDRHYPADLWQGPNLLMNNVEAFYPYAWNEDDSGSGQYNFYLSSQGELWSAGETHYSCGSTALGTEKSPYHDYERIEYYNNPRRLDFPGPVLKMFYDARSFGGYIEHHGYDFTSIPHFALLRDGRTYAWGCNHRGDLGVGLMGVVPLPTQVLLPGPIDKIYFSQTYDNDAKDFYETLFAILQNGDLYTWGNNTHNKLGLGTLVESISTPERIVLPQKVIAFVSDQEDRFNYFDKNSRNFATLADGSVYLWGIFNGKNIDVPTKLNLKVKQLIVGQKTDLVLSEDGKLYNLNLGIPEAFNHPLAFNKKVEEAEIEYFDEGSGNDSFVLARLEDNSLYAIDLNKLALPAIKILEPLNTLDVREN